MRKKNGMWVCGNNKYAHSAECVCSQRLHDGTCTHFLLSFCCSMNTASGLPCARCLIYTFSYTYCSKNKTNHEMKRKKKEMLWICIFILGLSTNYHEFKIFLYTNTYNIVVGVNMLVVVLLLYVSNFDATN